MRTGELVKIDKDFRYFRKAETIAQSLQRRWNWYQRNTPTEIGPAHERRYIEILNAMQRQIANENKLWEINTSLSSRPILSLPVSEIQDWIWTNLPKPRPALHNNVEQSLIDLMSKRQQNLAAQQHRFLLGCEIAYRAKLGYYMIFNTLTVSPEEYYNVFRRNSRHFKDYIRRANATTRTADANTHFACVEEGSKRGRLHIHCLHFFRDPPKGARDPNYGRNWPDKRLLDTLTPIWRSGLSEPIIVRYSPEDAWGKMGFRWPIDYNTGEPMDIRSPMALATYMSKYITKAHNSCQRSKLLWRVRKSHRLGLNVLDEIMESLSTSTLVILATSDHLSSKLNNNKIPQHLLRLRSLKKLQNVLPTQSLNEYTSLLEIAKLNTPRLSPLQLLRASTEAIRASNSSNMQFLKTLGLNNEDTFKTAWHEFQKAVRDVDNKYFKTTTWGVHGTASTREAYYVAENGTVGTIRQSKDRTR